jgi:Co/Zn/Cd efflux system component
MTSTSSIHTETASSWETIFSVPKMDCPSEENLIRMSLDGLTGIKSLQFDLGKREVTIVHTEDTSKILSRLEPLNFGTKLISSKEALLEDFDIEDLEIKSREEAQLLKLLLAINGAMFLIEMFMGIWAQSTGLIADSLDMFADAAVYGVSLYAVGKAASLKLKTAHFAGWLQVILAVGALSEVIRRFMYGSEPVSMLMMSIGLLALAANAYCLYLIAKKRSYGAHMKASYIFSANDVIANIGVILAGALVFWTKSPYPDLVIGSIIAVIVLIGARKILQMK